MRTLKPWQQLLLVFLVGVLGAGVGTISVMFGYQRLLEHQMLMATYPQLIDALNKHEAALQQILGRPVAARAPETPPKQP